MSMSKVGATLFIMSFNILLDIYVIYCGNDIVPFNSFPQVYIAIMSCPDNDDNQFSHMAVVQVVIQSLPDHIWWRHQMEIFSALLAICAGNSPVSGEVPAQRPVTRSFDVFFDLCLNKRLSKQLWGWWFEMRSHPLWRRCNGLEYYHMSGTRLTTTNVETLHYCTFVRGIHRSPLHFLHKGPVMSKACPCHDVFMERLHAVTKICIFG